MLLPASLLEVGTWMEGFILVFLRISALFVAAPFFGANTISVRIRIVFASLISFVILPVLPPLEDFELMSGAGLLAVVQQLFLGIAMGFILQLVFTGLIFAGQVMAMTMGLGFATALDPQNGVQVTVVSQFYVILSTLIFLSLDLHLHLIAYLGMSFELLPITGAAIEPESFMLVAGWATHMFSGALLFALPVLAAILLINVAFGVMTRAAPQLNIFAVGFPVTIAAGFIFMILTIPSLLPTLNRFFEQAFEAMNLLLS
jgi:flagellar biosynthesis protein FliR